MMETVAVQPKSMLKSKTFWVNTFFFGLAVISIANEVVTALTGLVAIPAEVTRWLLALNAGANIFLRRISDQPARFTPETSPVPLQTFQTPPPDGGR